ncbi:coiled-coil-helix-coiled-coil-helix domain-containing protein 7 isoform X4 [Harpegnathos saltator]|uniref:coiled-coil-helix-coiled-coil-helix domain-containing protein 7 isoform X4 n=1 Tax=Harpegnathos saltator TaxID=610380 RepID=UPI0005910B2C|nr:coiled-coil-helix-coiled-coil-helix domain-containing protein 7 isoform X4 [Harpegnathos saltator]
MGMENKLNDVKERPYRINKHNVLTYDQEKNNPCYKEQILSLKCLDSHQNDRNVCDLYFTNYKNCHCAA